MRKPGMLLIAVLSILTVQSQPKKSFLLYEMIKQAQSQSPQSKVAQTSKEISYYQYLVYKSDLNPQISFYGNAPVLNKQYYGVRQPDGTIRFQPISQHNSELGFSLSQQLPFSGGQLSLNTNLTRFDDYNNKTRQYSSTPVYLQLYQPLFAYNDLKWRKKIEPLKLQESTRNYLQEMEGIAQQTASLFFEVLLALTNIQMAGANLQTTEANFETEKKRINLGTTTEDKLLQLQLQALKSNQELEKAKYDYQVAQLSLKTYIGWKEADDLDLSIPEIIPVASINLAEAVNEARSNRAEFIEFERKRLQAQADVAQAKAAQQQVTLVASYGYNNAAENFGKVYQQPNDQQRFSLGFNIPVVDWGRRKARSNMAKAMEKLTIANNEFDEATIYQEIGTLVKNIALLQSNITLALKADSVAQRRFVIANNLYQIGKLSVSDLNLAQSEKDNARRMYVVALRDYWNAWYQLRRSTLYDFEHRQPIRQTYLAPYNTIP